LGLGYASILNVQLQLSKMFGENFLTICKLGLDTANHLVTLLSNPNNKRNKGNFENVVSRLMDLKQKVSFIAVDFAVIDIKPLCEFLDNGLERLIEYGCVQNNVKLYLPLIFQGRLKMLLSKYNEVKKAEQEHLLKDIVDANFEDEFLYIDYGVDDLKIEATACSSDRTALLRKSSRKGIFVLLRNYIIFTLLDIFM
jgi:hypothetical protein